MRTLKNQKFFVQRNENISCTRSQSFVVPQKSVISVEIILAMMFFVCIAGAMAQTIDDTQLNVTGYIDTLDMTTLSATDINKLLVSNNFHLADHAQLIDNPNFNTEMLTDANLIGVEDNPFLMDKLLAKAGKDGFNHDQAVLNAYGRSQGIGANKIIINDAKATIKDDVLTTVSGQKFYFTKASISGLSVTSEGAILIEKMSGKSLSFSQGISEIRPPSMPGGEFNAKTIDGYDLTIGDSINSVSYLGIFNESGGNTGGALLQKISVSTNAGPETTISRNLLGLSHADTLILGAKSDGTLVLGQKVGDHVRNIETKGMTDIEYGMVDAKTGSFYGYFNGMNVNFGSDLKVSGAGNNVIVQGNNYHILTTNIDVHANLATKNKNGVTTELTYDKTKDIVTSLRSDGTVATHLLNTPPYIDNALIRGKQELTFDSDGTFVKGNLGANTQVKYVLFDNRTGMYNVYFNSRGNTALFAGPNRNPTEANYFVMGPQVKDMKLSENGMYAVTNDVVMGKSSDGSVMFISKLAGSNTLIGDVTVQSGTKKAFIDQTGTSYFDLLQKCNPETSPTGQAVGDICPADSTSVYEISGMTNTVSAVTDYNDKVLGTMRILGDLSSKGMPVDPAKVSGEGVTETDYLLLVNGNKTIVPVYITHEGSGTYSYPGDVTATGSYVKDPASGKLVFLTPDDYKTIVDGKLSPLGDRYYEMGLALCLPPKITNCNVIAPSVVPIGGDVTVPAGRKEELSVVTKTLPPPEILDKIAGNVGMVVEITRGSSIPEVTYVTGNSVFYAGENGKGIIGLPQGVTREQFDALSPIQKAELVQKKLDEINQAPTTTSGYSLKEPFSFTPADLEKLRTQSSETVQK